MWQSQITQAHLKYLLGRGVHYFTKALFTKPNITVTGKNTSTVGECWLSEWGNENGHLKRIQSTTVYGLGLKY